MHSTVKPDELAGRVRGPVLTPDAPGVAEEIAAFNTAIAQRPAVVVGATCELDVQAAIAWAGEHGLPVAVQATGHGLYNPADGGVLVTTKRMDTVRFDATRGVVRAGAGARWRAVLDVVQPDGRAPLSGSSSLVGVVGYTLGGGVGLLSRRFGFAADRVQSFTIVTADGVLRRVDADSEPDLYWAVLGGKSNFGIVTDIDFEVVPVASVYGATVYFDADSADAVLHAYAEWAPTMPTSSSTSVALLRLPEMPSLPEALRGKRLAHLRFTQTGDLTQGDKLLAPMLAAGTIVLERHGEMAFGMTDVIHQDPTTPLPLWERSGQLSCLDADAVDTLLATAGPASDSRLLKVELRQLGGALREQQSVPNAVSGRDAEYSLFMLGIGMAEQRDDLAQSGTRILQAMEPWMTRTTLVNFLGAATAPAEVGAAWSLPHRERLLAIKHRVDPENMFRFGHALV